MTKNLARRLKRLKAKMPKPLNIIVQSHGECEPVAWPPTGPPARTFICEDGQEVRIYDNLKLPE